MLQISCITKHFYPETAEKFRKLCDTAGIDYTCPDSLTCCGLPYFERGELASAKKAGEYNLSVIGQNQLICNAPKCRAAYTEHYPKLFNNTVSHNAAVHLSKHITGIKDIIGNIAPDNLESISGHYFLMSECCSGGQPLNPSGFLKGCKWSYPSLQYTCCGAGASLPAFSWQTAIELSYKIIDEFIESGADAIVCEDDVCRKQLDLAAAECGKPVKTLHIIDLLIP